MSKKMFDFFISFASLLVLSPILLFISVLIKLDSHGPVFYRGTRAGTKGQPFKIYKFRTMVIDAEKKGGPSTADDDTRITRVGKILRKIKLDELPQLLNILEGDMSFVGPRPEVYFYVDMYNEEEKNILNVKPGITDRASIWNSDEGAILKGSIDPEKTYMEKIRPTKIKLQLEYVQNNSFWSDISIIFDTMNEIFIRRNRSH